MKRIIVLILACLLVITGCANVTDITNRTQKIVSTDEVKVDVEDAKTEEIPAPLDSAQDENKELENELISDNIDNSNEEDSFSFTSIKDASYQEYLNEELQSELSQYFDSESYMVSEVKSVYISQEYIDEVAYNSKPNVYFGYTLEELDKQFQGTRYVFTLGENGQTTVVPYERYDDTWDKCLENVCDGTGALIQSVTIVACTPGVKKEKEIVIYILVGSAVAAGTVAAVVEGVTTAIETGDAEEALKHAAMSGSEGYKMAAIIGYEVVDYLSEQGLSFGEE